VHDPANRAFLERHNPQALRSIGERLIEAMQRGLWQDPGDHRERIAQHLLTLEHRLETQGEGPLT
jgi:cobaltochelatase CobN